MGRIGDYVHYRMKNYRKYGINKRGEPSSGSAVGAFAEQRARFMEQLNLLPQYSQADIAELETVLNALVTKQTLPENQITAEMGQELERIVTQVIEDRYRTALFNWDTMSLEGGAGFRGRTTQLATSSNEGNMKYKTILNKLESIEKGIRYVSEKRGKQSVVDLKQQLNVVKSNLRGIATEMGAAGNKKIPPGLLMNVQDLHNKHIIDDINRLIGYFALPSVKSAGDAFEYVLLTAGTMAFQQKASSGIEQLLGDFISSIPNSKPMYKGSNLPDKFIEKAQKQGEFQNYGKLDIGSDNYVTYASTLEKVDISFNMPDIPQLNVSAKNALGGKGGATPTRIKILNSTSLLSLLQGENSDFVTHYMNLMATHPDGNGGSSLTQAHEIAKLSAAAQALVGSNAERAYGDGSIGVMDRANVLIVNNKNKAGSIKVYSMYDLINTLSNKADFLNAIEFENYPDSLSNDWVAFRNDRRRNSMVAANERITQLLIQMHQAKIKATLVVSKLK